MKTTRMRSRYCCGAGAGLAAVALAMAVATAAAAAGSVEWPYFGGSKHFDRYSPLSRIDSGNVNHLQTVWTRPGIDPSVTQAFPDLSPSPYLRGTPIMIDGVLYAPDAVGLVEAFDAASGKTLWVQKPFEATLKEAAGVSSRGVGYWSKGGDKRLVSMRGEFLYELDAQTGTARRAFGDNGRISLNRHTPDGAPFFGFNGPMIVGDVIVVGGNGGGKAGGGYGDGGPEKESTPEDIRGYDIDTGRQLWQFHLIPQPGEPGRDTWGDGSADVVGNMAAWAPLSADEKLGYVYVPLTAPTNSYYGGHRPGNNLYADSLVALNVHTGKLVWYYQMIHHDLWDYDISSVCVAAPLREVTSFIAETKSATRVTSARSSESRLSCAPVNTSCSRMSPSRSRSNKATVSVRRICWSCISVTAAIETCRDWSIAEREDCSSSLSDLLTAPVASSPAEVMVRATSLPWLSIDCEKVWPLVSIARSASEVTRSTSTVSWLVLEPIASTSEPRLPSIICASRSVCCWT